MEMNELIQNGLENSKRVIDRTLDGLTPAELNGSRARMRTRLDLFFSILFALKIVLFTYCKVNHSFGNRRSCTRSLTKQLKMVEPIIRQNRLLPLWFRNERLACLQ